MKSRSLFVLVTGIICLLASAAQACDPCAIYSATQLQQAENTKLSLELYDEYTRMKYQAENLKSHHLTALNIGVNYSKQLGLQLHIPRVKNVVRDGDNDSGLGDMSLLVQGAPIWERTDSGLTVWGLALGVKFPTGDTGSLDEPVDNHADEEESDVPMDDHDQHMEETGHAHLASARHGGGGTVGRMPTLGSGSYDLIMGTALYRQFGKLFVSGSLQYMYRTEGDFDYQFGNDLVWRTKFGRFFALDDQYSFGLGLALTGENKPRDERSGDTVAGTKIADVYLGPEATFTLTQGISGEFGLDFPIDSSGDEDAGEPDFRVRSSLRYSF